MISLNHSVPESLSVAVTFITFSFGPTFSITEPSLRPINFGLLSFTSSTLMTTSTLTDLEGAPPSAALAFSA